MARNMSKPGLSIESAASVTLRNTLLDHMRTFNHVIRADRAAGKSVHAEYVNALAGTMALMIAGGQCSRDDIVTGTATKLIECLERDLKMLGQKL
jgi:hypothetical protein